MVPCKVCRGKVWHDVHERQLDLDKDELRCDLCTKHDSRVRRGWWRDE